MPWWLYLFVFVIFLIFFRLYINPPKRWCRSKTCLIGKTTVVTGANSGLGFETALDFAKRGAKVILACRNRTRAENARREIIKRTDNPNIFVKILDLSSFASVRAFAKEMYETEERLDILVNSAGIAFQAYQKTVDGYDLIMQTNYYSHFLLTHLLIDLMKKSKEPSRVVNMSSMAALVIFRYDMNNFLTNTKGLLETYAVSKLNIILFTKELGRRLQNTNITTYSVHPGCIQTDIFNASSDFLLLWKILHFLFYTKSAEKGAQVQIYCAVEKDIEKWSGGHFDNCRKAWNYWQATVPGRAKKLWEITEAIVGLKDEEKIKYD